MAIENVKLGAGKLSIMSGGIWVDVGETEGASTLTYTPEYYEVKVPRTGTTTRKLLNLGQNATLEMTIVNFTKANIHRAAPLSVIYTSGGQIAMGFGGGLNKDLFTDALRLKFHPYNTETSDNNDDNTYLDDDFIFWKAASSADLALAFAYDDTRKIPTTFQIFKDDTQDASISLFIVGDPAVVGITQTAPALIDTLPANAATAVALDAKVYIVLDQQLVDDQLGVGDVGLCLASTGVEVASTKTYGKTLSQLADSTITVNNPATVTSTTIFNLAAADVIAAADIINDLVIKIVEGACSHITTISDYSIAGEVTMAVASPFTFTTAATYEIYGAFIEIDPTAALTTTVNYVISIGGVQGKNLMQKTDMISRTITTT